MTCTRHTLTTEPSVLVSGLVSDLVVKSRRRTRNSMTQSMSLTAPVDVKLEKDPVNDEVC